ncbi:hypothetical protein HY642_01530 [Candidatus Woesearchaeota archaeon]|nr:hypothetical protein [Candidatus Woesearchaeota archaeon]
MATPLDLLGAFSGLFPFLFVLVLVFAVLTRIKPFSERVVMAGLLSVILAVMTSFSGVAVKTINRAAPYFVLLFFFIIFALMVYQLFGIEEKKIAEIVTGEKWGTDVFYWMLALILIISIGSLTSVLSEEKSIIAGGNQTVAAAGDVGTGGFVAVITHPKVLGMALVLLTASFTIKYLSEKTH